MFQLHEPAQKVSDHNFFSQKVVGWEWQNSAGCESSPLWACVIFGSLVEWVFSCATAMMCVLMWCLFVTFLDCGRLMTERVEESSWIKFWVIVESLLNLTNYFTLAITELFFSLNIFFVFPMLSILYYLFLFFVINNLVHYFSIIVFISTHYFHLINIFNLTTWSEAGTYKLGRTGRDC